MNGNEFFRDGLFDYVDEKETEEINDEIKIDKIESISDSQSISIEDSISKQFKTKKEIPPTGHSKLPSLDFFCNWYEQVEKTKQKCSSISIFDGFVADNNVANNKVIAVKLCEKHYKEGIDKNIILERQNQNQSHKSEQIENDETINPVSYETNVLPIDSVLCDHSKNYARHGKPWLFTDPEVQKLAGLINHEGCINPPEVRKLKQPIERDKPTKYAKFYEYEIVSGFCRHTSLCFLGRTHERFSIAVEMDDEQAFIHNGIENWGRTDPTEYDLAMYITFLVKRKNYSASYIAKKINAKLHKVEELISIIDSCPEELLEIFRVSPTSEVRRDLYKISLIRLGTKEESQHAMIEEWHRLQLAKTTLVDNKQNFKNRPSRNGNEQQYRNGTKRIIDLRNEQVSAHQWFDDSSGSYRPITDEMRSYADSLLRFLSHPRTRNPFK